MHGCEGTSLPKLLKLDFSRFGNLLWVEQLVDEIRHIVAILCKAIGLLLSSELAHSWMWDQIS